MLVLYLVKSSKDFEKHMPTVGLQPRIWSLYSLHK